MQRTADTQLLQCSPPRAVIAVIVEIGAVNDRGQTTFLRHAPELMKQRVFAAVAPVLRILPNPIDGQNIKTLHDMTDALPLTERPRLRDITLRYKRRAGGKGHDALPEHIMSHLQQKGGIHPAGKSHRGTADFLQTSPETSQLLLHDSGHVIHQSLLFCYV